MYFLFQRTSYLRLNLLYESRPRPRKSKQLLSTMYYSLCCRVWGLSLSSWSLS